MTERDLRLIRLHCDHLRRRGCSDRTIQGRRGTLRRLTDYVDLLDATAADLDRWQASLTVSTSSIATYSMHVRGFYRWAASAGHIPTDPAAKLPMPKVPQRDPRPIPERDLELVLSVADEPLRTWLLLAAFMGLRSHEIAQLRREDIITAADRLVLCGLGKGGKTFRLVIPTDLVPALTPHLRGGKGPLWRLPPSGRAAKPRDCTEQCSRLMRELGLPYTLHSLRHRYGTAFYADTHDLLLTADVMRHSNTNTTRGYVATGGTAATAAMDRLARKSLRPRQRRAAA